MWDCYSRLLFENMIRTYYLKLVFDIPIWDYYPRFFDMSIRNYHSILLSRILFEQGQEKEEREHVKTPQIRASNEEDNEVKEEHEDWEEQEQEEQKEREHWKTQQIRASNEEEDKENEGHED